VDGFELAVRAIIGQQVSVIGARTIAGRLVAAAGELLPEPNGDITHLFPTPAALAGLADRDPAVFSMPASRRRALVALADAVGSGALVIDPGSDPWTAEYVAMRALRDPDAFMATDLGIRRGAQSLGLPDDPVGLTAASEAWRPWRSYAMVHLWARPDAQKPQSPTATSTSTTSTVKKPLRGRDAA
jgi:AraC family transcriptional regulator of adaptative response / DNA-3-methyladenine glycosylase II